MIKIFEHKIVITVLSEIEDFSDFELSQIDYEITAGESIGDVNFESVKELTREEAEQRCYDLRSDPAFLFPDE